jgi:tRNA dimethylallyltransferase
MFEKAVENMKVSTRQYAKRQISWIRNKLLPAIYAARSATATMEDAPNAFLLDATGSFVYIYILADQPSYP